MGFTFPLFCFFTKSKPLRVCFCFFCYYPSTPLCGMNQTCMERSKKGLRGGTFHSLAARPHSNQPYQGNLPGPAPKVSSALFWIRPSFFRGGGIEKKNRFFAATRWRFGALFRWACYSELAGPSNFSLSQHGDIRLAYKDFNSVFVSEASEHTQILNN